MKVGIVGTGTLGPSIAQVFIQCDKIDTVYLCKGRDNSKNDGLNTIKKTYDKLIAKAKIKKEDTEVYLTKLVCGTKSLLSDADLVIEAVSENLEIKCNVFKELDKICNIKCIFATNTSSLPIKLINKEINRPVIGMHFFNPAPVMELVEIVVNEEINKETVDFLVNISNIIGKTPVIVQETPGFIVNHVLIPMINEVISIYAEGIASAEDIDTAMKLGANHPMGPLALADLIGLDVVLAILEVMLKESGDPKYKPEALLKKMVRENKLGRKTGEGFYTY